MGVLPVELREPREPRCLGVDLGKDELHDKIYSLAADVRKGDWCTLNGRKYYVITPNEDITKAQQEHRVMFTPERRPEDVFTSKADFVRWFGVFVRTGKVKPGFERR